MALALGHGQVMAPGGAALGYEPLAWGDGGLACSSTCNNLQSQMAKRMDLSVEWTGRFDDPGQLDAAMPIIAELPKEGGR